jgi:hypothetical protein
MSASLAAGELAARLREFHELERRHPGEAGSSVRLPVVFIDGRFRVTKIRAIASRVPEVEVDRVPGVGARASPTGRHARHEPLHAKRPKIDAFTKSPFAEEVVYEPA